MIKEERRRKKRRKIGLYILLILILLIAAGVFIVMNVFTVENVVVEGNELYSSTQIENMVLNDEYSWNSLYVDLKYRFVDIGEVPFVDTMEVSLDNPHTVHIKVYEKGMLGYLYINSIGQNAYFDKDGFVVETSTEVIDGVPKITGISCEEVVLYEKLQLENSDILRDLLNLTQTLKKYNLLPDEIQYDSNMEPVLYYGTIQVKIGSEDNLSQKVVRLSIILPQLDGLSGCIRPVRGACSLVGGGYGNGASGRGNVVALQGGVVAGAGCGGGEHQGCHCCVIYLIIYAFHCLVSFLFFKDDYLVLLLLYGEDVVYQVFQVAARCGVVASAGTALSDSGAGREVTQVSAACYYAFKVHLNHFHLRRRVGHLVAGGGMCGRGLALFHLFCTHNQLFFKG